MINQTIYTYIFYFCISLLPILIIVFRKKTTNKLMYTYLYLSLVSVLYMIIFIESENDLVFILSILGIPSFIIFINLYLKEYKKTIRKKFVPRKEQLPTYLKDCLEIIDGINEYEIYQPITKLTHCNNHSFKVHYCEDIEDDNIVVDCECCKCNKVFHVFNSKTSGEKGIFDKVKPKKYKLNELTCKNCKCSEFEVTITLEYPDNLEEKIHLQKELKKHNEVFENNFTSIDIKIRCSKCGKKSKFYVDYECD